VVTALTMGTQTSKSPQKHRKDRSRSSSTSPEAATQSSSSSSSATASGAAANRNYSASSSAAASGPSTSSQEEADAAFARRLAVEEQEELRAEHAHQREALGLGTLHRPHAPAEMHTARATCPLCAAQNEFSAALGSQPVMMQCGSCSGQFQVAMPSQSPSCPSAPSGAAASSAGSSRQSLQLCRRCGTMNQFPAPAIGQPMPDVLCGFCGSITPASTRRRVGGQRSNEARLIEQMLMESQGRGRPAAGPMVRVNVGGQRRLVPLALLLALMAEEADKSNPAYHADIASLPTRKLAAGDNLNLGEQMRCMVCLEDFGDGDDLKTLPCLHIFHQKCIEQWLHTDNSCPICKTPIGHLARGA